MPSSVMQQFGTQLLEEMRAVVPRVTGKTAASLEYVQTKNALGQEGFDIIGDETIYTLIDGRGPTKNGAAGKPTLREQILGWINARNITPQPMKNGKVPTREQLAWMISSSIHRNGNKLFQRGGGNNIFGTILTESRMQAFGETFVSELGLKIESNFIETFKNAGIKTK